MASAPPFVSTSTVGRPKARTLKAKASWRPGRAVSARSMPSCSMGLSMPSTRTTTSAAAAASSAGCSPCDVPGPGDADDGGEKGVARALLVSRLLEETRGEPGEIRPCMPNDRRAMHPTCWPHNENTSTSVTSLQEDDDRLEQLC